MFVSAHDCIITQKSTIQPSYLNRHCQRAAPDCRADNITFLIKCAVQSVLFKPYCSFVNR